jgi:hypothetical protein
VADIFEEVDDDLKEENLKKLWDRYGKYAAALVVLIIVGATAGVGWRSYVESRQIGYSDEFGRAVELAQAGNNADAASTLSRLAEEASAGYAMLARFREAATRRANNENPAAMDLYETLAEDESIEPLYRDLAVLLGVIMQAETGDPAALSERLTPLVEGGPWRHSAGEYLGLLALRQGDSTAARQRIQAVADDAEAPAGIRARAAELLRTLDRK